VPDFPPLPVPVWLVAHRELLTSRRMRVVFDSLAEDLAQSPSRHIERDTPHDRRGR
jgi:hypothetical protein